MLLFIRAVNTQFQSRDEGAEYERPEDALALGIQSAIALAADEIDETHQNVAVEVVVEREDGTGLLRSVVAIAVSPLMIQRRSDTASTTSTII